MISLDNDNRFRVRVVQDGFDHFDHPLFSKGHCIGVSFSILWADPSKAPIRVEHQRLVSSKQMSIYEDFVRDSIGVLQAVERIQVLFIRYVFPGLQHVCRWVEEFY